MSPGLTLADYRQTLECMGQVFRYIEQRLAEWPLPEDATVPAYWPRYPAIARDLAILEGLPAPEPERLEPPSALTPFTTLGVRYVIDGSSLGSVYILRTLRNNLPELANSGALHYWQAQARAGKDWPALCQTLMGDYSDSQRQQALNGAQWAFGCFQSAFAARTTATDTAPPAHPPG